MDSTAWTIGFGFTSECNMRCSFCYSQDQRTARDLPLDDWMAFFRKNSSRITAVNYGTGENTLSEAWFRFIDFVRSDQPGIVQALTTNGHLAEAIENPGHRRTVEACLDEIDVSIDFAQAERHDRWRGFQGAHERAVRTLAFCRESGKRATIVLLGEETTLDLENLAGLFDLAVATGALVRINLYRHVSRWSPIRPPRLDTVLRALDWIVERHFVVSISEPVFKSLYGVPTVAAEENGPSSLRILSNGDITPSTYLISPEWVADNIRSGVRLEEIDRTQAFRRFKGGAIPGACQGCRHRDTCRGGARDRRLLTWDTLDEPDPYCPLRAGGPSIMGIRPTPKMLGNNKTVHSDYLPTMIFAPSPDGGGHVAG